jgi:hypothetical protein
MPFQPGDHLSVHRRRNGVHYTHHAINFPDAIVVEFGGSTADKPAMGIGYGTYERFAGDDRVDVVHHGGHDHVLAVRRAEWLVSCPPTRPYNAIGFNCEHIARWCATGWETESIQIRHGLFGGRALAMGLPITFWLAWLQRTGREMPRWGGLLVGAYLASTVATQFSYHNEIRHFNQHIRANCPPELRGP